MRLLRHLPLFRCVICGTVALVNILHPFLHGTPLDSGMLDGIMVQMDVLAASFANTRTD